MQKVTHVYTDLFRNARPHPGAHVKTQSNDASHHLNNVWFCLVAKIKKVVDHFNLKHQKGQHQRDHSLAESLRITKTFQLGLDEC